jgi:cellulose biosynthesis protein BcsQ
MTGSIKEDEMPIITMASEKGGPGKSTVATSLASWWAGKGKSVFLLDLDPQKTTSRWATKRANNTEDDLAEVAGMFAEPSHLKQLMGSLSKEYDVVLVDTPGVDSSRMRSALSRSQIALFVIQPGGGDYMQAKDTIAVVNEAMELRPEQVPLYASVVLNKTRSRQVLVREIRDELGAWLSEDLGEDGNWHIAKAEFGSYDDFARTLMFGMGAHEYAPNSRAARQIRALAAELEQTYGLFE